MYGVKFGVEGRFLHDKFHPRLCRGKFYWISEYKRSIGGISLARFLWGFYGLWAVPPWVNLFHFFSSLSFPSPFLPSCSLYSPHLPCPLLSFSPPASFFSCLSHPPVPSPEFKIWDVWPSCWSSTGVTMLTVSSSYCASWVCYVIPFALL